VEDRGAILTEEGESRGREGRAAAAAAAAFPAGETGRQPEQGAWIEWEEVEERGVSVTRGFLCVCWGVTGLWCEKEGQQESAAGHTTKKQPSSSTRLAPRSNVYLCLAFVCYELATQSSATGVAALSLQTRCV